MALLYEGMRCAICGEPIDFANDDFIATTYWGIVHRTFARLDDAAMHQRCIDTWMHRDAYVAFYNAHCCNELRVNRRGRVVYRLDWSRVLMEPPFSLVAAPIIVPIAALAATLFGESFGGIALSILLPIVATLAGAIVAAYFSGFVWVGVLAGAVIWTVFCFFADWRIRRCDTTPPYEAPETKPCPKCAQPLRTARAQQCFHCGADWH